MESCCICQRDCDGSLIRTNPAYHRGRDMLLADEVPRTRFRAGIKLCHLCQREVYFCGGFNRLLVKVLMSEARLANAKYRTQETGKTIARTRALRLTRTFLPKLRPATGSTILRREAKKIVRSRPSPPKEKL